MLVDTMHGVGHRSDGEKHRAALAKAKALAQALDSAIDNP
jgi:hypothetical protein